MRMFGKLGFLALGLCLAGVLGGWRGAAAGEEEEPNNGQDMTRPLTRVDIRYEYQNGPGSQYDDMHIMTLRMDKPFKLAPTWSLATRFDIPFMATNRQSLDNPNGKMHFGLSDVLVQGMIIHTPSPTFAWALGAQVVFPTASEDGMGNGKYRIVPTGGVRWTTNNILKGSFFALAARWDKDIAAAHPTSTHVNELQFAPMVNIPLKNQWFINLFPSTDIRYNLGEKRAVDKGRLFLPADVLVGKMLRKNMVGTLEVSVPIIKDYRVYDFKSEARIGILF